jgi:hypothetical protein
MIRNRYLLLALMLFFTNCLYAQSVPTWGGGADEKDLSFGFSFGYLTNYFKIDKAPNWQNAYLDNTGVKVTDPLKSISSPDAVGFSVGFLTRYRLTEHLEARVTPSLIFADRSVNYTYITDKSTLKSVQSTAFDIPLALKIKSDRIGDFRGYIIGGLKYSQAIGGRSKADVDAALIDKQLKNISHYFSYDAGLGCDIYFEFFKLSPEIKLSNSFGNVLLHEDHPYASPLNKLTLHSFMFSLYFE